MNGWTTSSSGYRARRLRDLAEPIGANVYFAPEAHAAYEAAGLIPPPREPGQRRAPLASVVLRQPGRVPRSPAR